MKTKFMIAAIAAASLVSTAPMAIAQSSKANEVTKSDGLTPTPSPVKKSKTDLKKSMNSMTNGQKSNSIDGRTPDTRKNSAETGTSNGAAGGNPGSGANAGVTGGANAGGAAATGGNAGGGNTSSN